MHLKIALVSVIMAFGAGCGQRPAEAPDAGVETVIVDPQSYRQSINHELDRMAGKADPDEKGVMLD
jgi:hypothetical protein